MFLVVWKVVRVVNIVFQDKIARTNMEKYMDEFKSWRNLLNIHACIDDTHWNPKLHCAFLEDDYYHKNGGFNLLP